MTTDKTDALDRLVEALTSNGSGLDASVLRALSRQHSASSTALLAAYVILRTHEGSIEVHDAAKAAVVALCAEAAADHVLD